MRSFELARLGVTMVPGTQNVARAERSRARPSLGGGTRRECTRVVIEVSWSPFMGPGSGAPHVPPGGVTVRPLMYAILLGTGSEGVSGATWCNSLLGRLLRGRSDTPQFGIGAQRYPFICSCLIINLFGFVWLSFLWVS